MRRMKMKNMLQRERTNKQTNNNKRKRKTNFFKAV